MKHLKRIYEEVDFEKEDIFQGDELYYFGLTFGDIRQIIKLVTEGVIDIESENYDITKITLSVYDSNPSPYNDFAKGEYICASIPLKTEGDNLFSFDIKIWDDGFVAFDNGNGIMMRYPNAPKVYDIINNKFKK